MGLLTMGTTPNWAATYSTAATISAADSDPSLVTDGTAIAKGAGILQIQTHTLSSITDYSLEVWLYTNSAWSRMVIPELTSLGSHAVIAEVEIAGYGATRWDVIVPVLTGTSLKLQARQI